MKRRPAYARRLSATLANGQDPRDIIIFIDDAPPDRPMRPTLAVFPDTDPSSLDWAQVAGRDVLVADADRPDRDRLRAAVQTILAARPRRLVLLMQHPPYAEHIVIAEGGQ